MNVKDFPYKMVLVFKGTIPVLLQLRDDGKWYHQSPVTGFVTEHPFDEAEYLPISAVDDLYHSLTKLQGVRNRMIEIVREAADFGCGCEPRYCRCGLIRESIGYVADDLENVFPAD